MLKKIISITLVIALAAFASVELAVKPGDDVVNVFASKFDATPGARPDYVSLKSHLLPKYDAVMFSFFNSTCENCKKEIPKLQKLRDEYEEKGVFLFFISSEPTGTTYDSWTVDGIPFVNDLLKEWGMTNELVLDDHYTMTAKKYGVEQGGVLHLPATFIVGSDNKYHYAHTGFEGEKSIAELRAVLDKLTGGGDSSTNVSAESSSTNETVVEDSGSTNS